MISLIFSNVSLHAVVYLKHIKTQVIQITPTVDEHSHHSDDRHARTAPPGGRGHAAGRGREATGPRQVDVQQRHFQVHHDRR